MGSASVVHQTAITRPTAATCHPARLSPVGTGARSIPTPTPTPAISPRPRRRADVDAACADAASGASSRDVGSVSVSIRLRVRSQPVALISYPSTALASCAYRRVSPARLHIPRRPFHRGFVNRQPHARRLGDRNDPIDRLEAVVEEVP